VSCEGFPNLAEVVNSRYRTETKISEDGRTKTVFIDLDDDPDFELNIEYDLLDPRLVSLIDKFPWLNNFLDSTPTMKRVNVNTMAKANADANEYEPWILIKEDGYTIRADELSDNNLQFQLGISDFSITDDNGNVITFPILTRDFYHNNGHIGHPNEFANWAGTGYIPFETATFTEPYMFFPEESYSHFDCPSS
jgi:hypothetical protein